MAAGFQSRNRIHQIHEMDVTACAYHHSHERLLPKIRQTKNAGVTKIFSDGNTRVKVLEERGYDVNTLSREEI